jgi:hypothetical protein
MSSHQRRVADIERESVVVMINPLQADESAAAFSNETVPEAKKRRTGKINF